MTEMADRFHEVLMKKVMENHYGHVEDLCTAFISRTGMDPELVQTVTEMTQTPEGNYRWTTYFERRTHG